MNSRGDHRCPFWLFWLNKGHQKVPKMEPKQKIKDRYLLFWLFFDGCGSKIE